MKGLETFIYAPTIELFGDLTSLIKSSMNATHKRHIIAWKDVV